METGIKNTTLTRVERQFLLDLTVGEMTHIANRIREVNAILEENNGPEHYQSYFLQKKKALQERMSELLEVSDHLDEEAPDTMILLDMDILKFMNGSNRIILNFLYPHLAILQEEEHEAAMKATEDPESDDQEAVAEDDEGDPERPSGEPEEEEAKPDGQQDEGPEEK